ncbi:MAG: hypothetical protein HY924_06050 [Elusimicrobia bacterium]|nr:hypothetical protein [Elusimicrobiota bacterium]
MPEGPRLEVANLWGSPRERGRQMGELFGHRVRESGIVDFYHDYCSRHMPRHPVVAGLGTRLMLSLVALRFSASAKALIQGFCETSGLDPGRVSRGFVMPDVLNFLVGFSGRLAGLPTLGCTSAAAWGDYTRGGKYLFARNLDFPGMGYFDRFPVVCRHKPDHGIPYVSVGTAGLVVDGITGVNAEGLIVALHQHISRDVSILTGGRPILDLGRQVLEGCGNLRDAVDMVSRWRTTSCWTVILGSSKERKACAVERSPGACCPVWSDTGKLGRANDFVTPRLHAGEIDYRPWRESSRLRIGRVDDLLESRKGSLEPAFMASLLSDRYDSERGTFRSFAQSIGQVHNMTSVVFEPDEGRLWVSESRAPAHQGPYRRLNLWDESPLGEPLAGVVEGLPQPRRASLATYVRSIMDWQARRSPSEMLEDLHEAMEGDPEEPVYRYLHGFFAMKAGLYETAVEDFAAGSAMKDIPQRQSAQKLWHARALDLLERRPEAVERYSELCRASDLWPVLRRAALHGVSRSFTKRSLARCSPDFFYGDVFPY